MKVLKTLLTKHNFKSLVVIFNRCPEVRWIGSEPPYLPPYQFLPTQRHGERHRRRPRCIHLIEQFFGEDGYFPDDRIMQMFNLKPHEERDKEERTVKTLKHKQKRSLNEDLNKVEHNLNKLHRMVSSCFLLSKYEK